MRKTLPYLVEASRSGGEAETKSVCSLSISRKIFLLISTNHGQDCPPIVNNTWHPNTPPLHVTLNKAYQNEEEYEIIIDIICSNLSFKRRKDKWQKM